MCAVPCASAHALSQARSAACQNCSCSNAGASGWVVGYTQQPLIMIMRCGCRGARLFLVCGLLGVSEQIAAQGAGAERATVVLVVDSVSGRVVGSVAILADRSPVALTSSAGLARVLHSAVRQAAWLIVRKVGFAPESLLVASLGDTARVQLRALSDLPEVRIAGIRSDRAGFQARCEIRGVECIVAEQLSARPSARVSDFLGRISGNERRCAGRLDDCTILMRASTGGKCVPTYFLDGALVKPLPSRARGGSPANALADLERFLTPPQVMGIEVYRSGQPIPPRFEPGNGCGAIVVWTK